MRSPSPIEKIRSVLPAVTEVITGDSQADLMEVFPNPGDKETRDASEWKSDLSSEGEQELRRRVEEIGPGRESDITPEDLGLTRSVSPGYYILHEGGQAHKVLAQESLLDDVGLNPSVVVYSAATSRPVGEKETKITAELLGIEVEDVGETEFEVIKQIILKNSSIVSLPTGTEDSDKNKIKHTEFDTGPFATEDSDNFEVIHPEFDSGGQFNTREGKIGNLSAPVWLKSAPVWLMPIVRREQENSENNQLTNRQKIEIVGAGTLATVALATSSTYEPSNTVAAESARRQTKHARNVVISYGTETLARIKGGKPAEPSLDQIAAELYKTVKNLRELDAEQ